MSKKLKVTIIIVYVIALVIDIALMMMIRFNSSESSKQTTVIINGETKKTLNVELKDLYPGGQKEYEIVLQTAREDYQTTLRFRSKSDSEIKEYIEVKVIAGESTIEKNLSELLESEEDILIGQSQERIKLIYGMKEEAGNETQGKDITFYVDVITGKVRD